MEDKEVMDAMTEISRRLGARKGDPKLLELFAPKPGPKRR